MPPPAPVSGSKIKIGLPIASASRDDVNPPALRDNPEPATRHQFVHVGHETQHVRRMFSGHAPPVPCANSSVPTRDDQRLKFLQRHLVQLRQNLRHDLHAEPAAQHQQCRQIIPQPVSASAPPACPSPRKISPQWESPSRPRSPPPPRAPPNRAFVSSAATQ